FKKFCNRENIPDDLLNRILSTYIQSRILTISINIPHPSSDICIMNGKVQQNHIKEWVPPCIIINSSTIEQIKHSIIHPKYRPVKIDLYIFHHNSTRESIDLKMHYDDYKYMIKSVEVTHHCK